MKYFNPFVFIISLAIGLFFVYTTAPPKNVIVVYPTPHNYNRYQYRDRAGNCFIISQSQLPCPENKKHIITVPIQ